VANVVSVLVDRRNKFLEESSLDLFDNLRAREEQAYQSTKKLLGGSFNLAYDLQNLYDLFNQLSTNVVMRLNDGNQMAALLHSLQWLKNEAIAGTLTLMRGHITDSSNFSRRSLEICAFAIRIYQDPAAAKRWMEIGKSKKARERYESAFPAWQLVRDLLNPELIGYYKDDCLAVHPSLFAVTKRAEIGDDHVHRFRYFDLDRSDEQQIYFVMRFLTLCVCHAKIMEHLTTVFYPSGHFDQESWLEAYLSFISKFQTIRSGWEPAVNAHFEKFGDNSETAQ
jgi:hypothetical protein